MGEKALELAHPNAVLGRAIMAHPVHRISDVAMDTAGCAYVHCKVDVRVPEAAADLHTFVCVAVQLNTIQTQIELLR